MRDLWSFYSQYLYLPRLRDVGVLLEAIADGVGSLAWRQDGFAYDDARDEAAGRFAGLRAGEGLRLSDATGFVVQPAAAEAQLEAERGAGPASGGPRGGDGPPAGGGEHEGEGEQPSATVLRRFHGSVALDPTRLSRDASDIAEAVVAHLNGLLGASVEVTLEIHAEIPDGAPDNVVRTVTENAATLRFDPGAGFETE